MKTSITRKEFLILNIEQVKFFSIFVKISKYCTWPNGQHWPTLKSVQNLQHFNISNCPDCDSLLCENSPWMEFKALSFKAKDPKNKRNDSTRKKFDECQIEHVFVFSDRTRFGKKCSILCTFNCTAFVFRLSVNYSP